jgi:2-iminobutanoate/2-iminopropanoate deaminase
VAGRSGGSGAQAGAAEINYQFTCLAGKAGNNQKLESIPEYTNFRSCNICIFGFLYLIIDHYMKQAITTSNAPEAVGPYSQAIKSGNLVFLSGQIGLTPAGEMVLGGIEAEARQIMENLKTVLAAAGLDFSAVLKTTIYLADLNDFVKVNEIYSSYFSKPFPARATVGVAALPRGAKIEIEAVALSAG